MRAFHEKAIEFGPSLLTLLTSASTLDDDLIVFTTEIMKKMSLVVWDTHHRNLDASCILHRNSIFRSEQRLGQ
jgi:hypothetical protein